MSTNDLDRSPLLDDKTLIHGFKTPLPDFPATGGFASSSVILTRRGERQVTELRPGDMIQTYDHGPQRLLAIGQRDYSAEDLLGNPALRPIRVEGTAYGVLAQLDVAPLHRFLLRAEDTQAKNSRPSVLVRANDVPEDWTKRQAINRNGVSYYHLVFDRHEVVMAGGIWCESAPLYSNLDPFGDPHLIWKQDCDQALATLEHAKAPWRVLAREEVRRLSIAFKYRQKHGDALFAQFA